MDPTLEVNSKLKERNIVIDALKAVAIILVVIGHVMVSLYPENYNENILFKICYSFHMPLFIFVGGGVTAYKSDEKIMQIKWIYNCFKRLMIPYFIWTAIYCLIGRRTDFLNALFLDPVLWYLINLFICDLILFISVHTKKMKNLTLICFYILFFALYGVFRDGNLVIKNIALFFPFYLAGHIIFRSKEKPWVKYLKKYMWIGAILYPFSMIFFTYKQYDLVIAKIQSLLGITSYGGLIHMAVLFYNHFIVAPLGIMFAWFIVDLLTQVNFLKKPITTVSYVGRYTMFIYVLEGMSSYIIAGNFANNMLISGIILVIIRMTIPLVVAYILSFVPKLRLILFGQ